MITTTVRVTSANTRVEDEALASSQDDRPDRTGLRGGAARTLLAFTPVVGAEERLLSSGSAGQIGCTGVPTPTPTQHSTMPAGQTNMAEISLLAFHLFLGDVVTSFPWRCPYISASEMCLPQTILNQLAGKIASAAKT